MIKNLFKDKNRFLWYIYDFANSILFINISFYYSVWIIKDLNLPDYWVSIPVSLSTLVLLFILPKIGSLSDNNKKVLYLKYNTIFFIIFGIFLGLHNYNIWDFNILFVTFIIFLFYIFFQISLSIYNSLLVDISDKNNKDVVSGVGMAFGQMGNLFGVLLAMFLFGSSYYIQNNFDKSLLFMLSGFITLILIFPSFFIKEEIRTTSISVKTPLKEVIETLKNNKIIRYYLISYYFYIDGVLTLQLFIATYTTVALGFSEKLVTNLALLSLLIITLSSLTIGKLLKYFTQVFIIKWGILTWFFTFTSLVFVKTEFQFYLAIIANSLIFGLLFALSRSYYSQIIPISEQGKYFGIYTLFERSASIIGPLLWSLTTLIATNFLNEADSMRLNVFVLGLMVLLGFYFFNKHIKCINPVANVDFKR